MSSTYYAAPTPLKNMMLMIPRNIALFGFTVDKMLPKYEEQFYEEIPKRIASGEFKYLEEVTRGLQHATEVIRTVQRGANKGKSIVIVHDEQIV